MKKLIEKIELIDLTGATTNTDGTVEITDISTITSLDLEHFYKDDYDYLNIQLYTEEKPFNYYDKLYFPLTYDMFVDFNIELENPQLFELFNKFRIECDKHSPDKSTKLYYTVEMEE